MPVSSYAVDWRSGKVEPPRRLRRPRTGSSTSKRPGIEVSRDRPPVGERVGRVQLGGVSVADTKVVGIQAETIQRDQ